MVTSYLTHYLPEVITCWNFVHCFLAFKHFITTYVHLKTIILVSFGAETVLCSYTLFPSPPGHRLHFPASFAAECGHVTELWPMGCGQGDVGRSQDWTRQISVWSSTLFSCLLTRRQTCTVTVDVECWQPPPGSLNDCGPSPESSPPFKYIKPLKFGISLFQQKCTLTQPTSKTIKVKFPAPLPPTGVAEFGCQRFIAHLLIMDILWEPYLCTFGADELRVSLPRSVELSPRGPTGVEAGGLQSVVWAACHLKHRHRVCTEKGGQW